MSSSRPIKLYHFLPILNWWHSPFKAVLRILICSTQEVQQQLQILGTATSALKQLHLHLWGTSTATLTSYSYTYEAQLHLRVTTAHKRYIYIFSVLLTNTISDGMQIRTHYTQLEGALTPHLAIYFSILTAPIKMVRLWPRKADATNIKNIFYWLALRIGSTLSCVVLAVCWQQYCWCY
jgi:hypothetical protein